MYHKRDCFHRLNVEGKKPGTKEYHCLISFLSKTEKQTLDNTSFKMQAKLLIVLEPFQKPDFCSNSVIPKKAAAFKRQKRFRI